MASKVTLGLYFTDYSIEISRVSSDGNKLERYNKMSLLQGIVVDGEIVNKNGFVQALKQLLASTKPSSLGRLNEVVVGISDSKVFLREFIVPSLPGKNINDAIEYQIRSMLPVLPSGVETDWIIIGKDPDGQIEVLLVAIPRSIIESCVSVCSEVGMKVVAIEPAVFANLRVISPELLSGKSQLLVHTSENFGVFSFVTGANPRFSESLLNTEILKDGGIEKTVQTYINFANSKHPNRQVQEVLLSGLIDNQDSVVSSLQAMGIQAKKSVSRLGNLEGSGLRSLWTSAGLSLKRLVDNDSLNLLPVDYRLAVIKQNKYSSWKFVLGLLIFLNVLLLAGLGYYYKQLSDTQLGLKSQKALNDQALSSPDSLSLIKETDKINRISGQMVVLRGVVGEEENILKVLPAVTPEGVVLSSLVYSRGLLPKKMSESNPSWILTGSANSRTLVLDFYRKLIASKEFVGGQLYFGSLEKDTGLSFRIASFNLRK